VISLFGVWMQKGEKYLHEFQVSIRMSFNMHEFPFGRVTRYPLLACVPSLVGLVLCCGDSIYRLLYYDRA
jgi:hypothetical protein